MTAVAVPMKDLVNAKQRLTRILGGDERRELARAMLRDVLTALARAPVDAVWLVTRDEDVMAIAQDFGVDVLTETANRGHTAAVALAQAHALGLGVDRFVTVPGDVPCVTAPEIETLIDGTRGPSAAAAFTPSRSGLGTNGAALAPADAMPLTFGEPSFENHLIAARRLGLAVRVVPLPGLSLDIDGPDDLRALVAHGPATESARLLARWRIDDRLDAMPVANAVAGRE